MTNNEEHNMPEHYYTKTQTSQFRPKKIRISGINAGFADLGSDCFELYTAGGVFSPKRLDTGTRLLINTAVIKKGWKVLDFGCGYGVVGIAIKKMNPSVDIVLADINSRAIKLANMNLKLHHINAQAVQSDIFSNRKLDSMTFDTILLNPPQTAGKKICFRMIEESFTHLKKGGLLQLVARHQKGGKHLSKKMNEVFGNVHELAKGAGYRVYSSEKK